MSGNSQKVLKTIFKLQILAKVEKTRTKISIVFIKCNKIKGKFWSKKETDDFGILYTGYLLYIVNIMRGIERERDRETERQGKRERETER